MPLISESKWNALKLRMKSLEISEDDLVERFIKGSGSGGQKINKTSSCVQLSHAPTSKEIRCQKTRYQSLNRYYARVLLCDAIEEERLGKQSKKQQDIEKKRRQKRKRSKRAKEKILSDKKSTSEKKELRKKPELD